MNPEDYAKRVPGVYRRIYVRAVNREGGRSNAIRAKCLDCCSFQREVIAGCTTQSCPLWPWRPYQRPDPKVAPPEKP